MKKWILINDTWIEFHYWCQEVIKNLNYLLDKNWINIVDSIRVWDKKINTNTINLINRNNPDIIIVNWEWTIHNNRINGINLIKIWKLVKDNFPNIKIILINCTIEKMDKYIHFLKYFDLISVREIKTKEYLNKYWIETIITPDLSMYYIKITPQMKIIMMWY